MSNIDDKIAELERQIELLKSLKKADDPLEPYKDLIPIPPYPVWPYTAPWSQPHPIGCSCRYCRPFDITCLYGGTWRN